MVTLILRGDWADPGARAGSGKAFSNLPGAWLPNQHYLLPPVLICVNIFFLRDVVNLGRTKFVSPMIKEGVVFYETLPRFWVGNLLDVEPEMRWVGPICNYSMTIRMVGKVKMQNVKSFTWTNTEIRVRGILQLCATDCGEITWGMENCKLGRTCWRCCQRLGSWGCHLRWKNNDLTLTHLTCQIS